MSAPVYTLGELRTLARQLSDMENSNFISDSELTLYLNLGVREFYDILAESHGQEFLLRTTEIQVTPPTNVYDLPDDFHQLKGVDFSLSAFPTQATTEGAYTYTSDVIYTEKTDCWPLHPYMFEERHDGTDTAFHDFDRRRSGPGMRYRVFSDRLVATTQEGPIVPVPYRHRIRLNPVQAGYILVWYLPEAISLSSEDDDTVPTFHGLVEYAALYAAIACLDKEETDSSRLAVRLDRLASRIRTMAARDMGHPERIRDSEVW